MITSFYFWQIIGALCVGTIALRGLLVFLSSRLKISERIKEILSFIPAAILPAMVAPMVFYHQGQVNLLMGKERLVVLLLASGVCYYTKNMLYTIGFGLMLLYLLTQI